MKAKSIIVFSMILCLLLSSCNMLGFLPMRTVTTQANHIIFDNIDDLIKHAELIIIAKLDTNLKDAESVTISEGEIVETDFSSAKSIFVKNKDGIQMDLYTISPVKIQKVIKGNFEGKEIKVLEPYAITNSNVKYIYEGYSEMKKGDKYILFLAKAYGYDDVYSVVSLDQGKFNVDGLDKEEQNVQTEQAKDLKDKVMKKFSTELQ